MQIETSRCLTFQANVFHFERRHVLSVAHGSLATVGHSVLYSSLPACSSESPAFWFLLISHSLTFIIHNWNVIVVLKARQALKASATDWKCDYYHSRMVWRCTESHPKAQASSLFPLPKYLNENGPICLGAAVFESASLRARALKSNNPSYCLGGVLISTL